MREPRFSSILSATLKSLRPAFSSYVVASDAETIINLGKKAKRIAELQCNGQPYWDSALRQIMHKWDESDEEKADNAKRKIERTAIAILAKYAAGNIQVCGDPRGACLKFSIGKEEYGV